MSRNENRNVERDADLLSSVRPSASQAVVRVRNCGGMSMHGKEDKSEILARTFFSAEGGGMSHRGETAKEDGSERRRLWTDTSALERS
jgi:hypothetical protein